LQSSDDYEIAETSHDSDSFYHQLINSGYSFLIDYNQLLFD